MLHLQCLQAGLGQTRGQLRGLPLPLPEPPIIIQGMPDTDNRGIGADVGMEMSYQNHSEELPPRHTGGKYPRLDSRSGRQDKTMQQGEENAGEQEAKNLAPTVPGLIELPANAEN